MKSKSFPVSQMGTSLILCVFIILSLVTFAALSAVNTQRDSEFGNKIAQRTAAYYEASNQAENMLAEIDDALFASYSADAKDYYASAEKALSRVSGIEADFTGSIPVVRYQIPFGEEQALLVSLELPYPSEPEASFYQITSWKEISTREWHGENIVPVLADPAADRTGTSFFCEGALLCMS